MAREGYETMMVSTELLSPLMEECLAAGQEITLTITGDSMSPFLRHHRDRVVLVRPTDAAALSVGDVPLYRRVNGQLVLHRIVERDDGQARYRYGEAEPLPSMHVGQPLTYTMCGDAQTAYEPNIQPQQIVAVAVAFERKGMRWDCESSAYRARSLRWHRLMPIRARIVWLYHLPWRLLRKLGKTKEN